MRYFDKFYENLPVKMSGDDLEFEPSKEDLQHLREWISKSPHIIQDYDDKFLSAFVRGCKGRLQKTKSALEAFNSLGQRYPNMIKNYDPLDQSLIDNLSETFTFALPKKTPDGSIVFLAAYRHYEGFQSDPYKAHSTDFYRYWLLSLYTCIWKNDFGSGKWIIVCDMKALSITHVRELTPMLIKQATDMMQNAMPIRVQAIHVVNIPPFMEYILNLAKKLMKEKISERMYFHSTMEKLYQKFPREILPKEFGGSEESALTINDRWYKSVQSYRKEFLEEESKMRSLDPLRPKDNDSEEMAGTFKTLSVD